MNATHTLEINFKTIASTSEAAIFNCQHLAKPQQWKAAPGISQSSELKAHRSLREKAGSFTASQRRGYWFITFQPV
jgi:hypothetical protein